MRFICSGLGICSAVMPPGAAARALAPGAADTGDCDPRKNQPPASPTNRQTTARVYACRLVHSSLKVDLFALLISPLLLEYFSIHALSKLVAVCTTQQPHNRLP